MAIIIIAIIVLIIAIIVYKKKQYIKTGDVVCITGEVKTGKSTLAYYLARKRYKWNCVRWALKYAKAKIFRKELPERPLFYSNIRLAVPYVPLTKDLMTRKKRFRYWSVIFFDESSLIADSRKTQDKITNDRLKFFNKLIGHELHGKGAVYYATHTMKDNHYNIKRCMNTYLWIYSAIKILPLIYICKVQEMFYGENGEAVTFTDGKQPSDSARWIIVPKRVWKQFDSCTYSGFTDNLEVEDTIVKYDKDDLKTPYILTIDNTEVITYENTKNT